MLFGIGGFEGPGRTGQGPKNYYFLEGVTVVVMVVMVVHDFKIAMG
jgi:hypothetical protein